MSRYSNTVAPTPHTAHGAVGHGWQRVNRDDDHHGRRADARLDGFHLQGTASTQEIAPIGSRWVFSTSSRNTRFCHSTRKQRCFRRARPDSHGFDGPQDRGDRDCQQRSSSHGQSAGLRTYSRSAIRELDGLILPQLGTPTSSTTVADRGRTFAGAGSWISSSVKGEFHHPGAELTGC